MELEKFNRQLKLMSMLAGNTSLNVEQVARRLGMSRRTVYRYIRTFKESALFSVEQSGDVFRISRDSPFIREISDNVSFSEEEAAVIAGLLASAGGNSIQLRSLRNKIGRIYNYRVLEEPEADRRTARNLSQLYEAVKLHRVAVLKNYHSLHGGSVADRTVEPFAFLNSNDDVRCYELASGENKTFKVARAEEVIVLDLMWSNAGRHESYYTPVRLLGQGDTPRGAKAYGTRRTNPSRGTPGCRGLPCACGRREFHARHPGVRLLRHRTLCARAAFGGGNRKTGGVQGTYRPRSCTFNKEIRFVTQTVTDKKFLCFVKTNL